ncbi:MAG: hypothetical protein J6S14_02240 [Clostridia bacterium]|nr:hypothetical protein [Clostridia bacterium]
MKIADEVVKRKVGRPRKTPITEEQTPKPPPTETEAIKDIVKKKNHKSNYPTRIEIDSSSAGEVKEMLASVLRWYDKPIVKSDDECADRLNEFFASLAETGELPSVEKMALALGVVRTTLWNWENGLGCSAARTAMIKRAKEILAAMDAELVSRNKIPQVTYANMGLHTVMYVCNSSNCWELSCVS